MDEKYFIHPTSFVDDDVVIGEGTKIWHFSHIQSGVRIGKSCSFGQNVNVSNNVKVGNGCKVQNNVSLYEGVELEDYVFCGPSCVFTNDLTPRAKYPKGRACYKKTVVEIGASIGANATVVCGHKVGRWYLIGAGAVVTSNVPSHALMLGIPAKRVGWVCECGEMLSEDLCCYKCSRAYCETETGLEERNSLSVNRQVLFRILMSSALRSCFA